MRVLIMAGGVGTRLGLGEKPLISVNGKPLIGYVIAAFQEADCEPIVVTSPKTPMTMNWCRAQGIAFFKADGDGYISDMVNTVKNLEEEMPLIISVSDIPALTPSIITATIQSYHSCGKESLSTWVPAYLVKSCRGSMPYREKIDGIESCPAGVNILSGDCIDSVQEEFAFLLDEPRLALNINTREDLARAEAFLNKNIPD